MRFIHTADWHVGKTLRGRSRSEEHIAVLNEIVNIARDRKVDAIFVVGDLFDSSAPTPESERIVYNALLALASIAPHVVVISGNHDNAMRLEAIKPLLNLTNIYALSAVARPDDGGVFSFTTKTGETVKIALLPFLSQRAIIRAGQLMSEDAMDHAQEYADRADKIIKTLCNDFSDKSINLFLGHAMVQGGLLGGGERSAHTVFEYSISTSAFPPLLHYVGLGHLHRAQKLPASCPVWYSGSPIALDFSETEDVKSVNIVEAVVGKPVKIEQAVLQSCNRLRTVRGSFESLLAMKDEFKDDYLKVEIVGPSTPGLADQVRELLPNALDVRVVRQDVKDVKKESTKSARSPQELFAQYLKERKEDNQELRKLFNELLEEVYASHSA